MEKQMRKMARVQLNNSFPHNLILEIFCKLPPKSLCRFKCVSKSLCSSIKDPLFIEKTRPDILMEWDVPVDGVFEIFSINQVGIATHSQTFYFPSDYPVDFNLSRHCNGLMCYHHSSSNLGLFNPADGKFILLPSWSGVFEFGYDLNTKKYKVFGWKKGDKGCRFAVLTIEKNPSWKTVNNSLGIVDLPICATHVNGSLFWIDNVEDRIISFNLGHEEFGIVKLPVDKIDREEFKYTLFEFDEHLCLVERPNPKLMRCHLEIVNMWMLKDRANSSWILLIKDVQLSREGTDLDLDYTNDSADDAPVFGRNGEIMILAADAQDVYIFAFCFLNRQFRRIKVSGQYYGNMKLVKNHMENDLYLDVFVQRREKLKKTEPYCAGYTYAS